MKKRIAFFLAAVLCMGSLSGCSEAVPFLTGGDQEQQKVVMSNEIKIPITQVQSLNPVNSKEEVAYYIDKLIYEGLFELDDQLRAVPVLAERYVYDQDGASVTISLRSDVKWHDGSSFTAEDVKYSIDAYLSAYYANTSLYNPYIGKIKSVKTRGSDSVEIFFKSSTDMAVENLTFPILPAGQFKKASTIRTAGENFKPIGTGSYMVSSMDSVKEIVLEGFSGYHGTVPSNKIVFRVVPDLSTSTKLFAINDLSIAFSKVVDRDTYLNSKDVELSSFPSNEMELVGFNVNQPGLDNKEVRKALAYAIDAKEIMETGYFKSGVLNDNLYYPDYLGVESSKETIGCDLDKAKKLLEDAGYTDLDGNGYVEDIDGNELEVTILFNGENTSRRIAAQAIKSGLDKIFVRCSIEEEDWNGYNSAIASGNFGIFIGGYKIEDTFDLRFLLHSAYNNPARYSNERMDVLLDEMQSGISQEQRLENFKQIKKILNNNMPYYCLFYKTYGVIASPSLKGDVNAAFFDLYRGCEQWYCEYLEQENKNTE